MSQGNLKGGRPESSRFSPSSLLYHLILGFHRNPIPPNELNNLRKYRFDGTDSSIISKYILGPYWNFLVTLFPLWVAPNLLTLAGLLIFASGTLLTIWHSPTLANELPPWVCLYVAAAIFANQSLDAIDGKQARRTGMAGPLGELFDHGCDSLTLMLLGYILPAIFRLGSNNTVALLTLIGYLGFYVKTWEEYQTGKFSLGYISGPVEGILITVCLCLINAIYGGSIWYHVVKLPGGLSMNLNSAAAYCTLVFSALMNLSCLGNIYTKSGMRAFAQIVPFGLFLTACYALIVSSPELAESSNYLIYNLVCGLGFSYSVTQIIAAHVTKSKFPYWSPCYLPIIVTLGHALNQQYKFCSFLLQWSTSSILRFSALFSVFIYSRFIAALIKQFCTFLSVSCFRVNKQSQK